MCKFVEEERNMAAREAALEATQKTTRDLVKSFIALGTVSLEEISKATKLPIDEVKKIAECVSE